MYINELMEECEHPRQRADCYRSDQRSYDLNPSCDTGYVEHVLSAIHRATFSLPDGVRESSMMDLRPIKCFLCESYVNGASAGYI